jgi:hypothetical protein
VGKAIETRERAARWRAHHLSASEMVGTAQKAPLPTLRKANAAQCAAATSFNAGAVAAAHGGLGR